MNKFKDCLLITDVDGTLANGEYINPANIEAVRRFVADGGQVALATGRTTQSALPVAKRLGCKDGLLIINNGTVVYDSKKQKIVWQCSLPCRDIADTVISKFPQIGALLYCGTDVVALSPNSQIDALVRSERLTLTEKSKYDVNKILFSGTPDVLNDVYDYINSLADSGCTAVRSDDIYVEALPKSVDKGYAARMLSNMLSIDKSKIFAAGNYYNDISLLELAAVSCAPCESPDEVKRHADYIACPCRDGAVADFIEYLYKTQ
jgi:Cof subfamily protein (haloacid dehalogenase superfamily)